MSVADTRLGEEKQRFAQRGHFAVMVLADGVEKFGFDSGEGSPDGGECARAAAAIVIEAPVAGTEASEQRFELQGE